MQPRWSGKELALLAQTPLFQGLPEDELRWAAESPACVWREFDRDETIYSPKRFTRSLGVFLKGGASVTKGNLLVSELGRGDLFGAAALFNRREGYETTITALRPSLVAFFPEKLVALLMARCPQFCANYIRYLSERIHFLNRKIESLTAPGSAGKLSRYLLEECGESGTASCNATELARRLDVSRASLYRAFEELEGAGAIRREGKKIAVLSRERLEERI